MLTAIILVRTHSINGSVMLSEAKHPATSTHHYRWVSGSKASGNLSRHLTVKNDRSSWILRFAQNDTMKWL
jgi:hypothetical protein